MQSYDIDYPVLGSAGSVGAGGRARGPRLVMKKKEKKVVEVKKVLSVRMEEERLAKEKERKKEKKLEDKKKRDEKKKEAERVKKARSDKKKMLKGRSDMARELRLERRRVLREEAVQKAKEAEDVMMDVGEMDRARVPRAKAGVDGVETSARPELEAPVSKQGRKRKSNENGAVMMVNIGAVIEVERLGAEKKRRSDQLNENDLESGSVGVLEGAERTVNDGRKRRSVEGGSKKDESGFVLESGSNGKEVPDRRKKVVRFSKVTKTVHLSREIEGAVGSRVIVSGEPVSGPVDGRLPKPSAQKLKCKKIDKETAKRLSGTDDVDDLFKKNYQSGVCEDTCNSRGCKKDICQCVTDGVGCTEDCPCEAESCCENDIVDDYPNPNESESFDENEDQADLANWKIRNWASPPNNITVESVGISPELMPLSPPVVISPVVEASGSLLRSSSAGSSSSVEVTTALSPSPAVASPDVSSDLPLSPMSPQSTGSPMSPRPPRSLRSPRIAMSPRIPMSPRRSQDQDQRSRSRSPARSPALPAARASPPPSAPPPPPPPSPARVAQILPPSSGIEFHPENFSEPMFRNLGVLLQGTSDSFVGNTKLDTDAVFFGCLQLASEARRNGRRVGVMHPEIFMNWKKGDEYSKEQIESDICYRNQIQILLVPLLTGEKESRHLSLAALFADDGRVTIYDSARPDRDGRNEVVRRLKGLFKTLLPADLFSGVRVRYAYENRQDRQQDGHNCGVHVLMNARKICEGRRNLASAPVPVGEEDHHYERMKETIRQERLQWEVVMLLAEAEYLQMRGLYENARLPDPDELKLPCPPPPINRGHSRH